MLLQVYRENADEHIMSDDLPELVVITERSTYIDFFRGVMMLSVIHIHTLYWSLSKFTPDSLRHAAYLIDIPIFFFISGFLFKAETFPASIRSALKQFLRLYVHYVIISLLVAAGILLWICVDGGLAPAGISKSLTSIFQVKLKGELWRVLKMYDGNLWYIRTYFLLLLLSPLLVGIPLLRRAKIPLILFLFVVYSLTLHAYKGHKFIWEDWSQILFYALFFVLGAMYRAGEKDFGQKEAAFSFGINLLLAGLVFQLDGSTLKLTHYKFPPNYQYLIYTLLLVHVFILAKPYWGQPKSMAIKPFIWAGRNSFALYLIQGAVCSIPVYFIQKLGTSNPWKLYGIVFSFNLLGSIGLSWMYVMATEGCSRFMNAKRSRDIASMDPAG